jgi:hypothetical protein
MSTSRPTASISMRHRMCTRPAAVATPPPPVCIWMPPPVPMPPAR